MFYLLDMSRGSLSPGCECGSVVQNASVAIVFTLTFAPVQWNPSFKTAPANEIGAVLKEGWSLVRGLQHSTLGGAYND